MLPLLGIKYVPPLSPQTVLDALVIAGSRSHDPNEPMDLAKMRLGRLHGAGAEPVQGLLAGVKGRAD
jgi:hypothetical protein